MLPFFMPLQTDSVAQPSAWVAQAAPPAGASAPASPPSSTTDPPAAPQAAPAAAPPPYAYPYPYPQPYPYAYPYAYPYPAYGVAPPAYGPPGVDPSRAPRRPPPPEVPIQWFARLGIGSGGTASSEQNRALRDLGYQGSGRFVLELDGTYMFLNWLGAGAFATASYASMSFPNRRGPDLDQDSYAAGVQLPFLFGRRAIAAVISPRLGYGTGRQETTGDADFQDGFAFGVDISATSLRYHLHGGIGFLSIPTDAPGALGRDHDYGGVHVLIGGVLGG